MLRLKLIYVSERDPGVMMQGEVVFPMNENE